MSVHGKTSTIRHNGKTIYHGVHNSFPATHYHSLSGEAEEAFVTNSILELMPLTWLEGKPIGSGKAGHLGKNLLAAYRKIVDEALK